MAAGERLPTAAELLDHHGIPVFHFRRDDRWPYPLAAPGGVVKIASPKVSHRIAANLRAPSASLAGLPQAPETSFRTVASEWVTPHS